MLLFFSTSQSQLFIVIYTHTHIKCDRTSALDALFKNTLFPYTPPKIAVIGAGCSLATEPTAEVSHYYNISQVSMKVLLPIGNVFAIGKEKTIVHYAF